jgi:hypothetical protein
VLTVDESERGKRFEVLGLRTCAEAVVVSSVAQKVGLFMKCRGSPATISGEQR